MIDDPTFHIVVAAYENDTEGLLEAMLSALRSDTPDTAALRTVADMLDPASKRGRFRLELKRRKGNKGQVDDGWFGRVMAVGEIYDNHLRDGMNHDAAFAEAVKTAAMDVTDGGVGKSERTVRDYLHAYIAHEKALREG